MAIRIEYEKKEDLPEAFQADEVFKELFTEDDGKIKLTGVLGMKTEEDIQKLKGSLEKERNDHKQAKEALKPWEGMDPTQTKSDLERIPALEKASEGKLDESQMEEQIKNRLEKATGPLNQQIDQLKEQNGNLQSQVTQMTEISHRTERDEIVASIAMETKAHSTALPDIKSAAAGMLERDEGGQWVTKTGLNGINPGLPPKEWIKDMQKERPHWWPDSTGAGSSGGGGKGGDVPNKNPFSKDNWNMTDQALLFKQDPELAKQQAEAAGTTIGGARPA